MKSFYSLISVGLWTALTLASCGEEEIVNVNPGVEEAEQSDYTIKAVLEQPEMIGLASIQANGVFWKAEDAFTLWNRNTGKAYDFTIASGYDGTSRAVEAEFTGKAALQHSPKLLAVFPRRDVKVLNDLINLSIPDTCRLEVAEKYAYRAASADMVEDQVPTLNFSQMTAGLHFNLKSISDKDLQVAYVTLQGAGDVFPGAMTLGEDGSVNGLSGNRKSVTLDMGGQSLSAGGSLSGYLNLLPTTTGGESLLKSTTGLVLTVTLLENEQLVEIEAWKGTVKDLPLEDGTTMQKTAYQFCAGTDYFLALNVNDFALPEEGFSIDKDGNVHIYNADGLTAWANRAAEFGKASVTIEKRFISNNTLEVDTWTTIPEFSGTFDGNGVVIKGTVINSVDNNYGFIGLNKGTLKNICFVDASLAIDASGVNAGVIAGQNEGLIQNCTVMGASSISVSPSGSGNLGALVGVNLGKVVTSFAETGVSLSYSGNESSTNIGGLIGWNNGGTVAGCHALASIVLDKPANAGGLIGSTFSQKKAGVIGLSYAAGEITAQGTGWAVGGLIGNGENAAGLVTAVRGCYALTELPAASANNKLGGLSGRGNAATLSFMASYYLHGDQAVNGLEDVAGTTKLNTSEELKDHVEEMNNTATGSGLEFVVEEDGTLTVRPTDEGNEGPGFGDGGEI